MGEIVSGMKGGCEGGYVKGWVHVRVGLWVGGLTGGCDGGQVEEWM